MQMNTDLVMPKAGNGDNANHGLARTIKETCMTGTVLKHADLTDAIIGSFYDVYHELGHGFFESVYREALVIALMQKGLQAEREKTVRFLFAETSWAYFEQIWWSTTK